MKYFKEVLEENLQEFHKDMIIIEEDFYRERLEEIKKDDKRFCTGNNFDDRKFRKECLNEMQSALSDIL